MKTTSIETTDNQQQNNIMNFPYDVANNGFAGNTTNNNIVDAESTDIVELPADSEDPNNKKANNEFFIKTVTPYTIAFNKKDDKNIATLVFLCRDVNDKLLAIDRNIIVSEEEKELLSCIPFAEDDNIDFVSKKISNHMIITYLNNYITDMKFSVDSDFTKNENPIVSIKAKDVNTKEEYTITMSAETFVCMAFIDSYIFERIDNEHDLALASIAGSKIPENNVDFFLVDKIESIVSMAPAVVDNDGGLFSKIKDKFKKKKSYDTTIGLVIKISKFISNDEKEVVSILTPFDIGVKFDSDKFRGNTIASIENEYYGDADQYVSTLMINQITLGGIDKKYMILRGKTKDKRVRVFLFDSSIQKELQDMINQY